MRLPQGRRPPRLLRLPHRGADGAPAHSCLARRELRRHLGQRGGGEQLLLGRAEHLLRGQAGGRRRALGRLRRFR